VSVSALPLTFGAAELDAFLDRVTINVSQLWRNPEQWETLEQKILPDLAATAREIIVADVRDFSMPEWVQVDRRRSEIAHRGVIVFVTTPQSFDALMRSAPNLASWLGGEVFAYPEHATSVAAHRKSRLAALRAWSDKTDEQILDGAGRSVAPAGHRADREAGAEFA